MKKNNNYNYKIFLLKKKLKKIIKYKKWTYIPKKQRVKCKLISENVGLI